MWHSWNGGKYLKQNKKTKKELSQIAMFPHPQQGNNNSYLWQLAGCILKDNNIDVNNFTGDSVPPWQSWPQGNVGPVFSHSHFEPKREIFW